MKISGAVDAYSLPVQALPVGTLCSAHAARENNAFLLMYNCLYLLVAREIRGERKPTNQRPVSRGGANGVRARESGKPDSLTVHEHTILRVISITAISSISRIGLRPKYCRKTLDTTPQPHGARESTNQNGH